MPCHHSLSLCCLDIYNDLAVQATFSVTSCYSVTLNFCKLLKHRIKPLCLGCGKALRLLGKLSSCCILVAAYLGCFPVPPHLVSSGGPVLVSIGLVETTHSIEHYYICVSPFLDFGNWIGPLNFFSIIEVGTLFLFLYN